MRVDGARLTPPIATLYDLLVFSLFPPASGH